MNQDEETDGGRCTKLLKNVNRELIPVKIALFCWWGGFTMLFTYLAIHMSSLGLSVRQIGLIHSLLPIPQILSLFTIGPLADRFSIHKMTLLIFLSVTVLSATAILYTPPVHSQEQPTEAESWYCKRTSSFYTTRCDIECSKAESHRQIRLRCLTNCSEPTEHFPSDVERYRNECEAIYKCPCSVECYFPWSESLGKKGLSCDVSDPSSEIYGKTFYIYLFLRATMEFSVGSVYNQLETCAVLNVRKHPGSSFGGQTTFGIIGLGILPLIAGAIMDANSSQGANFASLFYLFDGVAIFVVIVTWFYLKFPFPERAQETREKSTVLDLFRILVKPEPLVFVLTIFFLGILWGFSKIFIPLRMTSLGADRSLVGLTTTLSMSTGLPLVIFSKYIINKLGHLNAMVVVYGAYALRLISCSILSSPEYILIFETLDGITYHFFWVTAVTYASLITPVSRTATVLGFAGAVHYCAGVGISGLIGGVCISGLGEERTVLGFGVSAILGFLFLGIFNCYRGRTSSATSRAPHQAADQQRSTIKPIE